MREVLARHGLGDSHVVAGHNATHPTFLAGDVVVKFFGMSPFWRKAHIAESYAHRRVSGIAGLLVPELIARGELCPGEDAPWPYLVTSRVSGEPWWRADLSDRDRRRVACDLGEQLRLLHALSTVGAISVDFWKGGGVVEALAQSDFPQHLVAQVAGFVASLPPAEPAFLHGDLVQNHVYVAGGRLTAVIDWGDAVVADRYYEVGKLHLHTFDGDPHLLRECLEAMGWEVDAAFARRVLGRAFERQAVGLAQHHAFDLFHRLAHRVDLQGVVHLDDLAQRLFRTTE